MGIWWIIKWWSNSYPEWNNSKSNVDIPVLALLIYGK